MLACLLQTIGQRLVQIWGPLAIWTLFVVFGCLGLAVEVGPIGSFLCLIVLLGVPYALAFFGILIEAWWVCLGQPVIGGAVPPPNLVAPGVGGQVTTCTEAQALLTQAQQALQQAVAARDAQVDRVRRARGRVRAAQAALAGALAAVAMAIFHPDQWLAAIGAVVIAAALLARQTQALVQAEARLAVLEAAVNAAVAAVAAAEALVNSLCGLPPTTTPGAPGSGVLNGNLPPTSVAMLQG